MPAFLLRNLDLRRVLFHAEPDPSPVGLRPPIRGRQPSPGRFDHAQLVQREIQASLPAESHRADPVRSVSQLSALLSSWSSGAMIHLLSEGTITVFL